MIHSFSELGSFVLQSSESSHCVISQSTTPDGSFLSQWTSDILLWTSVCSSSVSFTVDSQWVQWWAEVLRSEYGSARACGRRSSRGKWDNSNQWISGRWDDREWEQVAIVLHRAESDEHVVVIVIIQWWKYSVAKSRWWTDCPETSRSKYGMLDRRHRGRSVDLFPLESTTPMENQRCVFSSMEWRSRGRPRLSQLLLLRLFSFAYSSTWRQLSKFNHLSVRWSFKTMKIMSKYISAIWE